MADEQEGKIVEPPQVVLGVPAAPAPLQGLPDKNVGARVQIELELVDGRWRLKHRLPVDAAEDVTLFDTVEGIVRTLSGEGGTAEGFDPAQMAAACSKVAELLNAKLLADQSVREGKFTQQRFRIISRGEVLIMTVTVTAEARVFAELTPLRPGYFSREMDLTFPCAFVEDYDGQLWILELSQEKPEEVSFTRKLLTKAPPEDLADIAVINVFGERARGEMAALCGELSALTVNLPKEPTKESKST